MLNRRAFFGASAGAAVAGPKIAAQAAMAVHQAAPPMAPPMGYHGALAHGLGAPKAPADAVAFAKQRLDKLRGKSTAQKEHERTRHSQGIYEEVSTLRSVAPWMRARMISDRQYDFYQRQEERSLLGVIEGWLEG